MANKPHNSIFSLLVNNDDDAVGMFAYCVYKTRKIEFIENTLATKNRLPSTDELNIFYTTSVLPKAIKNYKENGNKLMETLVKNSLSETLPLIEEDIKNGLLSQKLDEVKESISRKNTVLGWLKEIASNITVNVLSIILIGSVIIGFKAFSYFSNKIEIAVGISTTQENQK